MKDIKLFLDAQRKYKQLIEEGYDVVLPPEPLYPVALDAMTSAVNYPMQKSMVDAFIDNVVAKEGINQKVMIITIDTGAKSKNKYIQHNFVDEGKDHTGENQPFDENGHLSFCVSQQLGFFNGNPLGVLSHPKLPKDFYLHSGEKGLMKAGSATYTMLNKALDHAKQVANKYKAKGYRVFISCSWGGGASNSTMTQLFTDLRDAGHFPFAAAGNSGSSGVNNPGNLAPDAIGHLLMTIGALDQNNKVASFSSRGPEVDFSSYGVSNLGCGPGTGDLKRGSGTSYSTPFAVGCAALLCSVFPDIENMNDLFYVLREGATDLGKNGKDNDYGYGLIRMDQYGEDDLPGEEPDNPPPPEEPEEEMPEEREIIAVIDGAYSLYWATLPQGNKHSVDGMEVVVEDAQLWSGEKSPVSQSGYDWKIIRFTDVKVQSTATKLRGEDLIGMMRDYVKQFFNNEKTSRGVVLVPPSDFIEAGEWGLRFAVMIGGKNELPIANITATVMDESDNAASIINKPL